MDIGPGNPQRKSYPPFKGDRIIVTKFPYQFGEPDRFDVAVFKYPGGAKTNYIKRIVGLPNETITIRHGDLLVRPDGWHEATIAQKPPDKVLAMLQPVYDNDHVVPELVRQGLPTRWNPAAPAGRQPGQWKTSEDLKSFYIDGTGPRDAWLYYHHAVASYNDWRTLQSGAELEPGRVRGQLITDFVPYNTEQVRQQAQSPSDNDLGLGQATGLEGLGLHWVSDLTLECTVDADQSSGQFLIALVKAGRLFRCEIDLATGQAALLIDGLPQFRPTGTTKCRGPGKHHVRFANVDQRLLLWVDDSLVSFDSSTSYWPVDDSRPQLEDLEPARIGSRQAAVRVSRIKLFRDIYYIAQRGPNNQPMCDYAPSASEFPTFYNSEDIEERLAEFFSNPSHWGVFKERRQVDFLLKQDQYLALGDNSAQSMDSRLWEQRGPQYYVDRNLLIGKALFIYWPHSWNAIPGTRAWPLFPNGIWFPYFPNFARMGAVR
jgi:signal peptidase I